MSNMRQKWTRSLIEEHILNLTHRLEEAKSTLEVMEAIENKKPTLWQPAIGETAWFLLGDGFCANRKIMSAKSVSKYITNHNVFKSAKTARKAAKAMKINNAVISACLQVDPDFEPDWSNTDQYKYYPIYTSTKI